HRLFIEPDQSPTVPRRRLGEGRGTRHPRHLELGGEEVALAAPDWFDAAQDHDAGVQQNDRVADVTRIQLIGKRIKDLNSGTELGQQLNESFVLTPKR